MKTLYEKIQIIHPPVESEPFVILNKPKGLPSAPIKEDDLCALNFAAEKFPDIGKVYGRKPVEKGLVHRIDNETEGLLLIATSQEFYDAVIEEQKSGNFIKTYSAICRPSYEDNTDLGFPGLEEELESKICVIKEHGGTLPFSIRVSSHFRPYGMKNRMVRPVTELSGRAALKKASEKIYSTDVTFLGMEDSGDFRVNCSIEEGYRHQVRCHLSWLGFPIAGDPLYDPSRNENDVFYFKACGLKFLGFEFNI